MERKFVCPEEQDTESFESKIKMIYEHIADDYSKRMFGNRLLYSMTEDYSYIRDVVMSTQVGKELSRDLTGALYVYGAGIRGERLVEAYVDKEWKSFIDIKKTGNLCGYPIVNLDEFQYEKNSKIVVTNKYQHKEIVNTLIRRGGCA